MKKRKKPPKKAAKRGSPPPATPSRDPADAIESQASSPAASSHHAPPSVNLRTCLSIGVVFHLVALTISLTSVVEPSETHGQLSRLLRFYLQPTHFTIDGRPLYLTHGDSLEQPHRLQVSTSDAESIAEDDWMTVDPVGKSGLASSDRYARWLSTAAMVAENEQPGLTAELLLPVVRLGESIRAVRIIRLPTDLTSESPPPYEARVIRTDGQVSLVQLRARRLSAIAVEQEGDDE